MVANDRVLIILIGRRGTETLDEAVLCPQFHRLVDAAVQGCVHRTFVVLALERPHAGHPTVLVHDVKLVLRHASPAWFEGRYTEAGQPFRATAYKGR